MTHPATIELIETKRDLQNLARSLGFDALGVANIELASDEQHLKDWLAAGFHGDMHYMQAHGTKRSRPHELAPGTVRCISVRINYWPEDAQDAAVSLADHTQGYVARYALGRDYHKLMRRALAKLALAVEERIGPFGYRVC